MRSGTPNLLLQGLHAERLSLLTLTWPQDEFHSSPNQYVNTNKMAAYCIRIRIFFQWPSVLSHTHEEFSHGWLLVLRAFPALWVCRVSEHEHA